MATAGLLEDQVDVAVLQRRRRARHAAPPMSCAVLPTASVSAVGVTATLRHRHGAHRDRGGALRDSICASDHRLPARRRVTVPCAETVATSVSLELQVDGTAGDRAVVGVTHSDVELQPSADLEGRGWGDRSRWRPAAA